MLSDSERDADDTATAATRWSAAWARPGVAASSSHRQRGEPRPPEPLEHALALALDPALPLSSTRCMRSPSRRGSGRRSGIKLTVNDRRRRAPTRRSEAGPAPARATSPLAAAAAAAAPLPLPSPSAPALRPIRAARDNCTQSAGLPSLLSPSRSARRSNITQSVPSGVIRCIQHTSRAWRAAPARV